MDTSWGTRLKPFITSEKFSNLQEKVKSERQSKVIFPAEDDVFATLSLPFDDVKVVILGQDPYHGEGQAHGLSFSVPSTQSIPPSLKNIFKEANVDKNNGDLTEWMNQGVLLLNSVLTVEKGRPKSHNSIGWQYFTQEILNILVSEKEHLVFLAWGRDAQNIVNNTKTKNSHLVLKSSHPSPLGCHYNAPIPFTGCKHFSQVNDYLEKHGYKEIDWSL